ncbi:protein-glutamine gamma-glutamyltransferase [Clostridium scatologenes]|uniref:Protein-glutamine gamma-glutamyltransferase n=1 Tax=Clostridium scatologenes TaxID=1548 RepID=A0A0E3JMR6_CLOSL|nr:protein-glutamine gamma-glutamyltransferase [Clostridium scatologenes]AKA68348.1 Protein-glutamine gamma-glutamyltransferase [Clostridium scatologenes]
MIKILDNAITKDTLMKLYSTNSIEYRILNKLFSSKKLYIYSSLNELKFQINLQISISNTSRDLYNSNLLFKVFRKSKCNHIYWEHTSEGGFQLKKEAKPSEAIKDIFTNGSKYGTECATAIVIIFYKALLNIFNEKIFNEVFTKIYLFNWHYIDPNLYIEDLRLEEDTMVGDCKYFKNPDVSPLTPEWQGENTIYLGHGNYYGHGLGIKSEDKIIKGLNDHRKIGSKKSSFLLDSVTRMNYKHLYNMYYNYFSKP